MSSNMTEQKIVFYNLPDMGGECVKYLLMLRGIDFKEEHIPEISTGRYCTHWLIPSCQFPVLEIDGTSYTDPLMICHYLASSLNLLGYYPTDYWFIMRTVYLLHQFRRDIAISCIESDHYECNIRSHSFDEVHSRHFYTLNELAKINNGYLLEQITLADIFFAVTAKYVEMNHGLDITYEFPYLAALKERVLINQSILFKCLKPRSGLDL